MAEDSYNKPSEVIGLGFAVKLVDGGNGDDGGVDSALNHLARALAPP